MKHWWDIYETGGKWLGMSVGETKEDAKATFLSCLADPAEVEPRIGEIVMLPNMQN